jgi:transposase
VLVITDNARIHHAKLVTEWLEANKDRIELFFLPPYAPEHNPDEYLNRQVKTNLRLKPTSDHDMAIERTMELLKRMQEFGGALVKKLFDSPLVRYARAGVNYELLAISYSK